MEGAVMSELYFRILQQAHLKEQIATEKEEGSQLAGKIVPSPSRLKVEMERLKQKIVSCISC